ncbi:DUF1652 domain-containing protein [Pseudomonas sp. UBA6310]|uniref:DUF1652 domain-containing protein n=1 Tax=Pseudomonas sp. UBA6310 TaxID=1947327 RepID=UPI0025808A05|nr:DUF1652 domain-containing protein [Pseudomonas sp. UBA6310]
MLKARIEQAFKPLNCEITEQLSSFDLRIFDLVTGETRLVVTGMHIGKLESPSSVDELISELGVELRLTTLSGWPPER